MDKHQPATPLPWKLLGTQEETKIGGFTVLGVADLPCAGYIANSADAAYIVNAANTYPSLRAALEKLAKAVGELPAAVSDQAVQYAYRDAMNILEPDEFTERFMGRQPKVA